MAYDYDKLYGSTPDALGDPTPEIVSFFDSYDVKNAHILDVGCGQGRDALFLARRGHSVVGIDTSPNGIADLNKAAEAEDLSITGIVADVSTFTPDGPFDVLLFDRTLHMLPRTERMAALARLLPFSHAGSWLLILDEASNIQDFRDILAEQPVDWQVKVGKKGSLHCQRPD